ncbi:MAG: TonB-dependent receptor plug domain-containing protein [Flavobacteriia bacterium]|nr:TonB-dependent receptor plug domain-containing protein [Flavobacteriia bacterium]
MNHRIDFKFSFSKSLLYLIVFLYSLMSLAQSDTTKTIDSLSLPGSKMPIFSTTAGDLNADLGSQDVSGLLQSSRDIFTSTAGFNFGNARFRIRGLGSENTVVLLNGIRVNDLETGWASWSSWGGLNDVTRFMEVKPTVSQSDKTFGGIGGYSNLDLRASSQRKGTRISYSYSNRSYRHRAMITHSTGIMDNGLSLSVSASRRYAKEGYVEGTSFDAWSYYLGVEKKIGKKHSLGMIIFGAPMTQGRQTLATQEAYDVTGNNYYNPNWGYQDGKKRNARMSESHRPSIIFTDYWKINEKTKLETSFSFSKGKNNLTNLNWYQAKDPRPDYYRYLPSYYTLTNPSYAENLSNEWANNDDRSQIDWEGLYMANSKNLYTVQNLNGTIGENYTGNRSKYIVENQISEITLSGFNMLLNHQFKPNFQLSAGVNYNFQSTRMYKTVNDLLGGDFWLDVDNFAERDFNDPTIAQNNVNEPNKLIKKGDKFGYDYFLKYHRSESFIQTTYNLPKFDNYLAVMFSTSKFWRDGKMINGRFPNESEGKSEVSSFANFGIKGGTTYKVTGRHFVSLNVAFLNRAPIPREVFVSPRTRNTLVSNLKNEELSSFDINYNIRYAKLKTRISLYYNEIKNITTLNSYYHEEYQTLVNYSMSGINQKRMGLEFGTEYNITNTITTSIVAAVGDYRYSSRPTATITRDNSTEVLASDRLIYLKNFKIGGIPQQAYSFGLKYSAPKFWFIGANFNYFADIYLEPNPDRRTEEAVANLVESDPQWNEVIDQTKFDNQYTIDVYAGKSWKIKKYFLNLNLNVNNVLNNKEFIIGGFEQMRYESTNVNRFPPKLSYHLGTTFYAMISLRF